MPRQLIVNADDFGLSHDVNRGIIECLERGIVTSASLMVRQPYAAEAANYAQANRSFSLGLHLDLGEWIYSEGEWVQVYRVVSVEDEKAVREEVRRQVEEFRRVVGRDPSHIDSHQHVHRNEPVLSVATQAARELGVPLRHFAAGIHFCGDFYGQDGEGLALEGAISLHGLKRILRELPEGITELGCHPGYVGDLVSVYQFERLAEVQVLSNPGIRDVLTALDIVLCSFDTVSKEKPA